ncbi:MAG: DUF4838 domain-containing protein [Victivallaceae bacterium]|nr:DUF4838 domain-containing protein [Victivallaceae bacterium]
MLKKIIVMFVCGILLSIAGRLNAGEVKRNGVKVVDNGKSNYAILIAPQALDSVKAAAQELQGLIEKVGGVKLPIQYKANGKHKYIVVGNQPFATKNGFSAANLSKDGFIITEKNGNIFLVGKDFKVDKSRNFTYWSEFLESDSVGSYFAMVEFARRFLGVEWYMPTAKGVAWQKRGEVNIPAKLNIRETPHFSERFIDGARPHSEKGVKKHLKRGILRHNYYQAGINDEATRWGRHMLLGNQKSVAMGHAWWQYMPPTKPTSKSGGKAYGKSNPEYYALRDGVRQNFHRNAHYGAQLCVSNPEVIKTYAANIIADAKKNGGKTFSLSENDGGGQCECKNCLALDGKDSVTGEAVPANRFIYFANKVAELVVKEIPDARLGIHAYNISLHSPTGNIKVHPNVYIGDVYNYLPNLWYSSDAERNKLLGYMQGWRQRAEHVFVVSYYNIYGNWGLPWDSTEVTSKTLQSFAGLKSSDGMRMYNCRYFGISPGVDGARLWVLARLYWEPRQDFRKLRDNYYRGAFGDKAGEYIKEYFDVINRATIEVMKNNPINIENNNSPLQCSLPEKIYEPIRKQCRQLIDQAVKAASKDNERIKWRVDRIAQAWRFTELTLDSFLFAKKARTGAYVETGLTLGQTWDRAVQAGKQRRKMLNSNDAYYALAQGSADICQRQRPLGIIEKMPENINLDVAVPLVTQPIVLDGKLDDKVWQNLPATRNFKNNRTGKVMAIKSWAKIFRTPAALVIGFHFDEPNMSKLAPNNTPNTIWSGDVAELYMSQTGSRMDFVQFLANPNSVKKAYIMRGDQGKDNKWLPKWQAKGFKGKDFWSVEMRIPFKSIGITAGKLKGKTVFVNFCRERYAGINEISAWSPTMGGFAQPSKFGRMNFNVTLANLTAKDGAGNVSNGKPAVNLLPGITPTMQGWRINRIGVPKQWKTTSKVIDANMLIQKDRDGKSILVIKNNKPPMVYAINLQQPVKVMPGDKFLLRITCKRDIINPKLDRNSLKSPRVRVTFDKQNLGKKRLWLNSTTTVKKIADWYSDEHKIYIDPASKTSRMWIKLSLFGENASIKNIELIKLR